MESKNVESISKSDQDDVFIENGIPKKVDKNNVKGKKRGKCLRNKTAPIPLDSGYIQFLNDRPKRYRSKSPNLSLAELTKVNTKWNKLRDEKKDLCRLKAKYLKYVEQLAAAYKKKDAHTNCIQRKMKKEKVNTQIQEDEEDGKFKKEKSSGDTKLKKDQELKKEKPSDNTKLKKEQESIKIEPSNDNFNTVYEPIVSAEFSIFNSAGELMDEEPLSVLNEVDDPEENCTISFSTFEDKNDPEWLKNEELKIKLGSVLLDAFADIPFPDNIEPLTKENIGTFLNDLPTLLTTDTDPLWVENIKKVLTDMHIWLIKP
uniref:High mobility group protein 20A n=1 Tax=Schizaphis graminum TaxID=13262 RepID=A0A2S2NTA2_SCHGA